MLHTRFVSPLKAVVFPATRAVFGVGLKSCLRGLVQLEQ